MSKGIIDELLPFLTKYRYIL